MFHRIRHRAPWFLALLLLLVAGAQTAPLAALSVVGPTDPVHTFPTFYQDGNGLALALCLNNSGLCVFDPVIPTNPFSVQIGMGAEAFYWLGDATIAIPGGQALLVMGMEAAFVNGDPAIDEQFPFGRIRIRIDAPVAGIYVVDFPYGQRTFDVVTPGPTSINLSEDIGTPFPNFAGALASGIGPFLQWDTGLPIIDGAGNEYIGDPAVPHTITGSPVGNNFFRIAGPSGSNLGGAGIDVVSTDLFTIQGLVSAGEVPTFLNVDSVTYSRTISGQIDAFASSLPTANVGLSGTGLLTTPLLGDPSGNFFGQILLADASILPAVVTVSATDPDPANLPNSISVPLVDRVQITRAEFNVTTDTLSVDAASSDQSLPPVLTALDLGALTNGSLSLGPTVPPATVTVNSAAGGSDTEDVIVVGQAAAAVCGNAILEPGETCDDGNVLPGDGCNANCQIEVPGAVCGNGILETGETCDDGNVLPGDGCDATCQIEVVVPANLVVNGDFAAGQPPWVNSSNSAHTFNFASGGALLSVSAAPGAVQLFQGDLALSPNTTYRLTFRGQCNTGHGVRVKVIGDAAPRDSFGLNELFNLTSAIQTFTTTFTTPAAVTSPGRLKFQYNPMAVAGDSYLIDDVVLEVVP